LPFPATALVDELVADVGTVDVVSRLAEVDTVVGNFESDGTVCVLVT
jgi:hypothetical protein